MRKSWLIYILLFIIIILLILFYYKGCCNSKNQVAITRHIPVDTSQVILWKNPDFSDASFKSYIRDSFPDDQVTFITYCKNCDSDLVLITGARAALFLSGQTTSGGSGGKNAGHPVGGDGPALWSMNFPIEIRDSIETDSIPEDSIPVVIYDQGNYKNTGVFSGFTPGAGSYAKDTVVVAVFDTGLDSALFNNYLYRSNIPSCLNDSANNGWNFYDNTPAWKDDYKPPHGTIVSKFIIDQANTYHNNFIKILPVKLHGSNGVSHLFDVLCALRYAVDRNVNIINASFGFYAQRADLSASRPDSSVLLFKKFLGKYLSEGHMLMIAAAGNKDDTNEGYVYTTSDNVAKRNLDSVCFYPASFARDIPNVIAVTTVSERINRVSPHQNFSPNVVDIGVNADTTLGDTAFLFKNPISDKPNRTVEGSSFATPVATGKIASNYYLLKSLMQGNLTLKTKQDLLDTLNAHSLLHTGTNVFADTIKMKRIMTK